MIKVGFVSFEFSKILAIKTGELRDYAQNVAFVECSFK